MTQFNPHNKEELSFSEIFEEALKIKDHEDAAQYLSAYAAWIEEKNKGKEMIEEPLDIARSNFGYWAGYYSHDVRRNVEDLFQCEHPVFGSIAENGAPTAKEAFEMGIKYAQGEIKKKKPKKSK